MCRQIVLMLEIILLLFKLQWHPFRHYSNLLPLNSNRLHRIAQTYDLVLHLDSLARLSSHY